MTLLTEQLVSCQKSNWLVVKHLVLLVVMVVHIHSYKLKDN